MYTPGFVDGLGERLLLFDHGTATSLELLRFKPEFGGSPVFEAALRARVDQLKQLHHPSLATIRSVGHLESGEGLVLVSKHTAGRRLSELIPKARGPVFALELIKHVIPVLATLQQSGEGIAHGALASERIVVTREGRLVVVEHVLGSALESLRLPASRVRSELGLALPNDDEPVRLDCRADVVQLGFTALSLLLGRRLDPADCPGNLSTLLDEFADSDVGESSGAARLRSWLEQTLQLGGHPFGSAQEANDALKELPDAIEPQSAAPTGRQRALRVVPAPADTKTASVADAIPDIPDITDADDTTQIHAVTHDVPNNVSVGVFPSIESAARSSRPADEDTTSVSDAEADALAMEELIVRARDPQAILPADPLEDHASDPPPHVFAVPLGWRRAARRITPIMWAAAGLAGVALGEALVIVVLIYARPANLVVQMRPPLSRPADSAPAGVRPAPASELPPVTPPAHALSPDPVGPKPATPDPVQTAARPTADATSADKTARLPDRFGGITLTSPIELQVFEGGKLVGSTSGPIALMEGSHALDLVNEGLGFRSRENANVKAGAMVSLAIAVPNGRISVNAVPWADVWIDGKAAGQTPLANLSMAVGQHEIIFRHPQLGEQRQTVVVKPDSLTRVSVNLQK